MRALFLIVVSVGLLATTASISQDVLRIVAVVNDEAISALDLEQRLKLFMANARISDNSDTRNLWRRRVLRVLVDERLKLQEAKRLGVYVSEQEIEEAIYTVALQPIWGSRGLEGFLKKEGIDRSVIANELQAQIAWNKIVTQRLLPRIFIGDDEIDDAMQRMEANKGRSERKLSEIFLSMDSPDESKEVMKTAHTLVDQLRSGAPFGPLARQFSEGSTAMHGGDIGWVQQGQLALELDSAIADLRIGDISNPIRSSGGIYIVKIMDQRTSSLLPSTNVRLAQLVKPFSDQPDEMDIENVREIAAAVLSQGPPCETVSSVASEVGAAPSSGDLGWLNMDELPKPVLEAVKALEIGKASSPVKLDSNIHIFFVCERSQLDVQRVKREEIANSIGQRRLMVMARRYMRDLRREAFLDENRL